MTNKLAAIINSLKIPKIKKILLHEMKFLVPNHSCLQNPWLGGYRPQIPVLSVLCPQLNLLNPLPPEQNSWVRHWWFILCRRKFQPATFVISWLRTETKGRLVPDASRAVICDFYTLALAFIDRACGSVDLCGPTARLAENNIVLKFYLSQGRFKTFLEPIWK